MFLNADWVARTGALKNLGRDCMGAEVGRTILKSMVRQAAAKLMKFIVTQANSIEESVKA